MISCPCLCYPNCTCRLRADIYNYITIYAFDVYSGVVLESWLKGMRAVTSGVSTGSALAVALKLLSWADRQPPVPALTSEVCDAISGGPRSFCWFSFSIGLVVGILCYAFVEIAVTCKWALVEWVSHYKAATSCGGDRGAPKPLYRLC